MILLRLRTEAFTDNGPSHLHRSAVGIKKMRVVTRVPEFEICLVDSYLYALSRALLSFDQSVTLLLTH